MNIKQIIRNIILPMLLGYSLLAWGAYGRVRFIHNMRRGELLTIDYRITGEPRGQIVIPYGESQVMLVPPDEKLVVFSVVYHYLTTKYRRGKCAYTYNKGHADVVISFEQYPGSSAVHCIRRPGVN